MTNFDPVSYLMGQKAAGGGGGGGGGGGSSTLSGLTDVDISNPTDGQTLVYNATSGKWENGEGGGSGVLVVSVNSVTEYTPATDDDPQSWEGTLDITVEELNAAFTGGSVSPVYLHVPVFGNALFFTYESYACPLFHMTNPAYSIEGDMSLSVMPRPLESFEVIVRGEPNEPVTFLAYGMGWI